MDAEFSKGETMQADYTPAANIATGAVVIIGDVPHICNVPGGFTYDSTRTTRTVALARRGGFYWVTASGVIPAGSRVYWDNTAKKVTLTETGNTSFGITGQTASTDGLSILVEHAPTAASNIVPGTVAATGSTQADAAAVPTGLTVVTGADATKGVLLPATASAGRTVTIVNNAAAILKVWPGTGGKVNTGATNGALSMAATTTAIFTLGPDGLTWWSTPRVPS